MVNAITLYRLLAFAVLLYFIFSGQLFIFKWLLVISFFTDAIDGMLARRFRVTSTTGSRIDSIADDLTVLAAIIGIMMFEPGFIRQELVLIIILVVLYLAQTITALVRYKKISSFHTWLAKLAAVLQGSFLVLIFFLPAWPLWLFHIAAAVTILDLLEEIILVLLLPQWQNDVRGLYWVIRSAKGRKDKKGSLTTGK